MDILPFVLRLGPLEITGFGILLMAAFLVAGWLFGAELRRYGLREEFAQDCVVAAVVGGVVGAKLWYVVLTRDPGALLSRGGLVWYGGLLGGALGVILTSVRRGVPIRWTATWAAPALAAAYSVGRLGCFAVGDDYGRPTDLPWAVRFPQGAPPSTAANLRSQFGVPVPEGVAPETVLAVHPTQLYETAIMLVAFIALWRLRRQVRPAGWLFGWYLVFAGAERFVVEILRAKDDRFFGPFTIAQVTSMVLVTVGLVLLGRFSRGSSPAYGPYLLGQMPPSTDPQPSKK